MAQSEWQSEVRWAECDAAGIIYHARVLDWFSEGRIVWLRDHGLDYYDVLRSAGIDLLVKSANVTFHHSLRPGDPVHLGIVVETVTPTRVTFRYRVEVPDVPKIAAIEGMTEHAFVMEGRARRMDRLAPDIFHHLEQSR